MFQLLPKFYYVKNFAFWSNMQKSLFSVLIVFLNRKTMRYLIFTASRLCANGYFMFTNQIKSCKLAVYKVLFYHYAYFHFFNINMAFVTNFMKTAIFKRNFQTSCWVSLLTKISRSTNPWQENGGPFIPLVEESTNSWIFLLYNAGKANIEGLKSTAIMDTCLDNKSVIPKTKQD